MPPYTTALRNRLLPLKVDAFESSSPISATAAIAHITAIYVFIRRLRCPDEVGVHL
jgi:hypothetical protein